ncbi:MAG: putative N-acetyltransferase YkkB [Bacteroidota bacterium]|jgi:[ribosomal protein S5]-alanine N-acetyltransferase
MHNILTSEYVSQHHLDRMIARPITTDDLDDIVAFYNDEEASRFLKFEASMSNESMAQYYLDKQLDRYRMHNGLMVLERKLDGAIVGHCGLLYQEVDGEKIIEIGYRLLKKYWQNGYASEAAKYFRNYGFNDNRVDALYCMIHPENKNSQKVALRLGMTFQRNIHHNGVMALLYGITRTAFNQIKK